MSKSKNTPFQTVSSPIHDDSTSTRFVVGIDLGTTNCAASYIDLNEIDLENPNASPILIRTFLIPQAISPDVVEERETLPSFFARFDEAPATSQNVDENGLRFDFSTKRRNNAPPRDGKFGVVGAFARDYGESEPDSFVSSAKSWLCYQRVDRTAKILPWNPNDVSTFDEKKDSKPRWSPVEISSFYLRAIRLAWNAKFPDFPLENQDVVLTIPASFDETARVLTLNAAKLAGLPRAALLEEPQAAFYSWLARHANDWSQRVRPGDKILVCDVGGGTTDFALIYALERSESTFPAKTTARANNRVQFYRVAVGDHLILGGDNLDLTLYQFLESKFLDKRNVPLDARERAFLLKKSREIKELFLSAGSSETRSYKVALQSAGSKLVGGSLVVSIEREEVERVLLDGFFPKVPFDAPLIKRRTGLREIRLPYASDPAITKHLANFLNAHRDSDKTLLRTLEHNVQDSNVNYILDARDQRDPARPDVVLFNGGAFESPQLRSRVVESLIDWFGGEKRDWSPVVLENSDLYLAVARGAAYYGLVLRGLGTRIGASLARSYYVGVALDSDDSTKSRKPKGVCLLAAQNEPGDQTSLPQVFELTVDRPVVFPIFVSSVRTTDAPGDLIEIDPNETRELSPIQTALKTRSQSKKASGAIRARLVARPTEIGTIELFLQEIPPEDASKRARASRWTLQFDARGGTQSDWEASENKGEREGVVDESLFESALRELTSVFATDAELEAYNVDSPVHIERVKPGELFSRVSQALGLSKNEIPIPTLRRLAEASLEFVESRRRATLIEARWLNWLGFALRPGFGAATDDWRVEQVWKKVGGRLAFQTSESRTQYWILWRRIASGLSSGRQATLAEPLLGSVRALRRSLEGRGRGSDLDLASQEGSEIWRLLGALELLPPETKEELGETILEIVGRKKFRPIRESLFWTLGRLGARTMFKAPVDRILPSRTAERWTLRLLEIFSNEPNASLSSSELFALIQLTRQSVDPSFEVRSDIREKVLALLLKRDVSESKLTALERQATNSLSQFETSSDQIFGETLPLGLRWV